MIPQNRSLHLSIRRWWRREDGSMTLEFLIYAPLMFFTFLGTLAFFDAFRAEAINEKAAMTIADMLSRETGYINDTYITGTYGLLQFLTRGDATPDMRVSVVRYEEKKKGANTTDQDRYRLVWSEARGSGVHVAMTDNEAKTMLPKLPTLTHDERLIVVETWSDYKTFFNLGFNIAWDTTGNDASQGKPPDNIALSSLIFVAPRVGLAQTCFNNSTVEANRVC